MKHLLFALLFITSFASAQTGNYTHDVTNPTGTSNQTYLMDVGIDTLSGSNDTLLVQFDRSFPGFYGITYTGVLAASSTSTTLKAELLGRNKSSETWVIIDDVNVTTEGSTTTLTADLNYMYLALRYVSTTGNAHVNSTILLKKKSSSAAAASAGGGASYLVYTALINQSGTDDPTAVVLENTLGFTVYFDRTIAGTYNVMCDNNVLTCTGFPFGRTFGFTGGVSDDVIFGGRAKFIEADESYWQLFIYDNSGALTDDGMVMMPLELRVYPE